MIPVLRLKGTPIQQATQYGKQAAKQIHSSANYYAKLFEMTTQQLKEAGMKYAKAIKEFNHEYYQQLQAIATAANISLGEILAINARSEILNDNHYECTSVALPNKHVLAQTWDWAIDQRENLVVLEIQQEHNKILTVVEAGMLGKIGLNTNNIAVALNALTIEQELQGVPIHILLRAALDATTKQEIQPLTKPHNTAANMLVLIQNEFINIEHAATTTYVDSGKTPYAHTNHYLGSNINDLTQQSYQSSAYRYERTKTLIPTIQTITDVIELLADTHNKDYPIHRMPYQKKRFGAYGTVCTVIMDTNKQELRITTQHPSKNEWQTIHFT